MLTRSNKLYNEVVHIPTFAVRETASLGIMGAPRNFFQDLLLRDDSALRALSSLRSKSWKKNFPTANVGKIVHIHKIMASEIDALQ